MEVTDRLARWAHWRMRPAQRSSNMYRGVYRNFAEANAAIGPAQGFDSQVGPSLYRERLGRIFPEDYPVLYWLRPQLEGIKRVFDFGGHVGLHYYAFATMLEFAPDLQWTVSDVPAVQREGETLAKQRGASALRFVSEFSTLDGCDVFLSSGALQYVAAPALAEALAACASPPRLLLLNKLPVIDGPGFVTVQDAWAFKAAYTVFNRGQLVQRIEQLGYRLRDTWENPGHHCLMWNDPQHSVQAFSGFYFERSK